MSLIKKLLKKKMRGKEKKRGKEKNRDERKNNTNGTHINTFSPKS